MLYNKEEAQVYVTTQLQKYYNIGDAGTSTKVVGGDPTSLARVLGRTYEPNAAASWKIVVIINKKTQEDVRVEAKPTWKGYAATDTALDMAIKPLLNMLSERVNKFLLEMIKYKPHHRTQMFLMDYPNWENEIPTLPHLRVFFDVDIKKHHSSPHRLVTFTDKYSSKQFVGHFIETINGFARTEPSVQEFEEIKDNADIELHWKAHPLVSDISFDEETGLLFLPQQSFSLDSYIKWLVIEESKTHMVVDFVKINRKNYPLEKEQTRYHVTIDEYGKPILSFTPISLDWVDKIRHNKDLYKNPLNRNIHEYLGTNDTPAYEGEHVWLTDIGELYIKLGQETWIPVNGGFDWVDSHSDTLPKEVIQEARRCALSMKLQE